ncbi:hypothetical protein FGO68_gene8413 [Halteria grandinella]|uniref:Uncharacterized protein n=1 Tax=Halteria grandinella TaxID=5974 RepID=A0A8J8NW58_HALGN|nr:hypothetical protein FGO68_gene8413 [Halteria grandinella]
MNQLQQITLSLNKLTNQVQTTLKKNILQQECFELKYELTYALLYAKCVNQAQDNLRVYDRDTLNQAYEFLDIQADFTVVEISNDYHILVFRDQNNSLKLMELLRINQTNYIIGETSPIGNEFGQLQWIQGLSNSTLAIVDNSGNATRITLIKFCAFSEYLNSTTFNCSPCPYSMISLSPFSRECISKAELAQTTSLSDAVLSKFLLAAELANPQALTVSIDPSSSLPFPAKIAIIAVSVVAALALLIATLLCCKKKQPKQENTEEEQEPHEEEEYSRDNEKTEQIFLRDIQLVNASNDTTAPAINAMLQVPSHSPEVRGDESDADTSRRLYIDEEFDRSHQLNGVYELTEPSVRLDNPKDTQGFNSFQRDTLSKLYSSYSKRATRNAFNKLYLRGQHVNIQYLLDGSKYGELYISLVQLIQQYNLSPQTIPRNESIPVMVGNRSFSDPEWDIIAKAFSPENIAAYVQRQEAVGSLTEIQDTQRYRVFNLSPVQLEYFNSLHRLIKGRN